MRKFCSTLTCCELQPKVSLHFSLYLAGLYLYPRDFYLLLIHHTRDYQVFFSNFPLGWMIEFEMFVVLLNWLKRFLLTLTSWLQHIILSSKEDGFTTKLPPFILLLRSKQGRGRSQAAVSWDQGEEATSNCNSASLQWGDTYYNYPNSIIPHLPPLLFQPAEHCTMGNLERLGGHSI